METSRTCRSCKTIKPLTAFEKHPQCRHGRTYICRDCCARRKRERYVPLEPARPILSETVKAYIAGLLDGEGWVGVLFSRGTYWVNLRIHNTDRRVMDFLLANVGGHVWVYDPHHPRRKVCYRWGLSRKGTYWLLGELLPYLIIKRDLGLAVREFCDRVRELTVAVGDKRTVDDPKLVEAYQRIRILNRRGPATE